MDKLNTSAHAIIETPRYKGNDEQRIGHNVFSFVSALTNPKINTAKPLEGGPLVHLELSAKSKTFVALNFT